MDATILSAFAGFGGIVVGAIAMSMRAGHAVLAARADAWHWESAFKRCAGEEGKLRSERDELKLIVSGLEHVVDMQSDLIESADKQIEEMQPLYELGVRRRLALDNQLKRDREARRGDEDDMVRALLEEYPEGVAIAKVMEVTGADSRRAGFLLRSVGAVTIVRAEGKTFRKVWVKSQAQADAA